MMNVIAPEVIEDSVKRFLGGIVAARSMSVIEIDGYQLYFMARPVAKATTRDQPWTAERNQRRHELIDKQLDETISFEEAVELAGLQSAFSRWLDAKAPLPLEHVRKLHDRLVAKALAANTPQ